MSSDGGKGDAPRHGADQEAYSAGWDRIFKRTIVGVAVKSANMVYSLPEPNRHHNVLRLLTDLKLTRNYSGEIEGFVDDKGKFLTRKEAYILASGNGQLKRLPGAQNYQGDELYSEDLW